MELSSLNTQSLTRYGGAKFDCKCGKEHIAKTNDIIFESGASMKLSEITAKYVPPLSMVGMVSTSEIKNLFGRTIEKQIIKGGYRVSPVFLDDFHFPTVEMAENINFPEDTKLIIGIGGGSICDIVKYKAQSLGINSIFVLTSPSCYGTLLPSSMLYENGLEQTFKTSPPVCLICDTEFLKSCPSFLTAAAFGGLISKLVSLFDWKVAALLNNEPHCEEISEQIQCAIDTSISYISGKGVSRKNINAFLTEQNLRFSLVAQLFGCSRLTSGAETQAAHTLAALMNFEERECKLRGENEFLLSRIIMKIYKNFLSDRDTFFVPPPDNNLRLELIKEFLGIDEKISIKKMRPIISASVQRLSDYKIGEYRDSLYNLVCDYDNRLQRAWQVFKRLYDDDGYSLVNYIDKSDASLSVALSPDLKEKFTMLTYLKSSGFLESYLSNLI